MANQRFSRAHPGIGRSAILQPEALSARAEVPADKQLDGYISDVEWACHRHKLVGEALRGMHELGVSVQDDAPGMRHGDLAALHAVISEFSLILCAELDHTVSAMRAIRRPANA